jgi:hypothetical protein
MSPLDISLADLIGRLDEEFPDAGELDRISEARLRARTLTDLGDQLLDHYVSRAKRAGASWSEIGDAIGVTKQAAQQRHTPAPFERFTNLNRHTIVLAQESARTHRHDSIGTEHLLLGLLGEPRGLAYEVLVEQCGSEQRVRDAVGAALPPGGEKALRGNIAFRPESKEAIEQTLRAAAGLGHDRVGTGHTLLGLIRTSGSPAAAVLLGLGLTPEGLAETVRAAVAARASQQEE